MSKPVVPNDELNLEELWGMLWFGRRVIVASFVVFSVLSVFFALAQPNVYRAEAVLVPSESSSDGHLASLVGQFGGLASMAGVTLSGGEDKTKYALEVLKSREFLSEFVARHELLVPLIASMSWDAGEKRLLIDPDVYNAETKEWLREPTTLKPARPTNQDAHKAFLNILSVNRDKNTGYITLGVEFFSPYIAQTWVEMLVKDLNAEIRSRDVDEAKESIEFLMKKLNEIKVSEMRTIFYELIEEHTKTIMFAEVRKEYALKTLDKAVVPEVKSGPSRALICVLGAISGVVVGGLLSLVVGLYRRKKILS